MIAAIIFLTPLGKNMGVYLIQKLSNRPAIVGIANTIASVTFLLIAIALLVAKSFNPFLYFRF
jgi:arginine exporter protein ArgO